MSYALMLGRQASGFVEQYQTQRVKGRIRCTSTQCAMMKWGLLIDVHDSHDYACVHNNQ